VTLVGAVHFNIERGAFIFAGGAVEYQINPKPVYIAGYMSFILFA
jgi:hypothetical protein